MKLLFKFFILFLFFNNLGILHAQTTFKVTDSLKKNSVFKKSIIPLSLISLGVLVNKSSFEKRLQTDIRNAVGNNYELKIDNYLQFAPILELYGAGILGVKAKNHWFDQTKNLFISNVASSTITFFLKKLTGKMRPNGRGYRSLPSGHTTFAFTNATVLYLEFKESSPVLAYSGYAFATTTGAYRMINNKHWFSDVLVGAGIGILVTKLVYHFEPFKNFNPFKKTKNITLIPEINDDNYGVYFSYSF
jgi:membrane-associated phospholipid phosphatase